MNKKLYYVQNIEHGTIYMWWKKNNFGYSADIAEARVFTQIEIDGMLSIQGGFKKAWPKEYIDSLDDLTQCDEAESYKP